MKNIISRPLFSSSQSIFIFLVLLIALVGYISMDIYFPSLPAICKNFNASQGTTQLTLTLFLCGFSISQLFYGPMSDYFGRRPILLLGFFIYLCGSIFLNNANSIQTVLPARLIQGLGAGAGASLCRVILRDKFVSNKMAKVTSYVAMGIALATALAPAAGGIIQDSFGVFGNFTVMLIFGAIVAFLVICFLPETNQNKTQSLHPVNILKSYISVLPNKNFLGNLICAGLALSGLLAYAMINPFLLQNNLHLSPSQYGLITLLIASGELVGGYINSFFVTRIGMSIMMFIGIFIMLLAGALSFSFSFLEIFSVPSVAIPAFLLTLSTGITIPNATAAAFSAFNHSIGTLGAIYGFFQIVITIVITYFISNIVHQTQWDLAIIFLFLAVISLVIQGFLSLKSKEIVIEKSA